LVGYTHSHPPVFGIWDRTVGGPPVQQFPYNPEGWKETWSALQKLEGGRIRPVGTAAMNAAQAGSSANVWGVLALVTGIVSLLILPILFAPLALIFGGVAISQGQKGLGWTGVVIGAIGIVIVIYNLVQLDNALRGL
jgi:hypothetical protein